MPWNKAILCAAGTDQSYILSPVFALWQALYFVDILSIDAPSASCEVPLAHGRLRAGSDKACLVRTVRYG
jgi:hypothetical protein